MAGLARTRHPTVIERELRRMYDIGGYSTAAYQTCSMCPGQRTTEFWQGNKLQVKASGSCIVQDSVSFGRCESLAPRAHNKLNAKSEMLKFSF
jgi:hypothetical protein